jgi:hypothetical protein
VRRAHIFLRQPLHLIRNIAEAPLDATPLCGTYQKLLKVCSQLELIIVDAKQVGSAQGLHQEQMDQLGSFSICPETARCAALDHARLIQKRLKVRTINTSGDLRSQAMNITRSAPRHLGVKACGEVDITAPYASAETVILRGHAARA